MAAPKGNRNHVKHGMRHTRLYNIWRSMNQRCYNAKSSNFARYGGRGIQVCDEWRRDFKTFHEWAMANGYTDDLTIERENVNGNYEPSNCRWATYKEQANNKRNSKNVEWNGASHTLGEWADITGISIATLSNRLLKGWSIEDTLTIKPYKGMNKHQATLGGA